MDENVERLMQEAFSRTGFIFRAGLGKHSEEFEFGLTARRSEGLPETFIAEVAVRAKSPGINLHYIEVITTGYDIADRVSFFTTEWANTLYRRDLEEGRESRLAEISSALRKGYDRIPELCRSMYRVRDEQAAMLEDLRRRGLLAE